MTRNMVAQIEDMARRNQPDDLLFSQVRTGELGAAAESCRLKCDGVTSCKALLIRRLLRGIR